MDFRITEHTPIHRPVGKLPVVATGWNVPSIILMKIISYYTLYYGDVYRRYDNVNENHIAGNGVNGITESGAWVTPFTLHKTDPKTMFIGYKNIWRSNNIKDFAPSWKKISDNLGQSSDSSDMAVIENSGANANILYAARSGYKLFRTDNCMDDSPGLD